MTTSEGHLPRALVIGDNGEHAPYHPLDAVFPELEAIFAGAVELERTEEYSRLRSEELAPYRLVVSYSDQWRSGKQPEEIEGLLSFVREGGALLVLHNGISLQADSELAELIGGFFTGHPDWTELSYSPTEAGRAHPMLSGVEPFRMEEEPYRFDPATVSTASVLLEYEHEGSRWPAAWARARGVGRVAYLSPGHRRESFLHPEYRKLVRQAGLWALGAL
ncbi:ThuA domain-containing protein [Paenibacillus albicereus]|uniref:ThuA domain-containing protein n=1 Tax=Paenibacillus albicereus TaxID=2726185 RepID=A0A6H2GUD8_9BACL|nr:ThuA domain-containing protein [Paenibacillus albicereus]QJC50969.1 ThuA domain-containing protein [Paenibacillus albicereus]